MANKNPYELRGIEKIPLLGHLSYMNRLDLQGHSINPKEETEDYNIMEKSLEYHAIFSSIVVLGECAWFSFG